MAVLRDMAYLNELSYEVIGAAMEVHDYLGPGLLETMYEECLAIELRQRGLHVDSQQFLHVDYKGVQTKNRYRLDLLVENCLIVEIKACEKFLPIHMAQTITYLKLTGLPLALLINFNVLRLKEGIRRVRYD